MFISFHIRQMIGLIVLQVLNWWIVFKYLSVKAGGIISFILFVLWIIGFLGAVNGQEKKIPLLGESFQRWFRI